MDGGKKMIVGRSGQRKDVLHCSPHNEREAEKGGKHGFSEAKGGIRETRVER